MANYTQLSDTLGGSEGKGFITRSGQNREMFEISKIDAHVTLTVAEKKLLGHRMKQHKVVGATGENGVYPASTLQFLNEDPQSTVGRQTVTLFHVILKTVPVAYLEDDSEDPITFDSDFTFDDCDCLEAFQLPENFR